MKTYLLYVRQYSMIEDDYKLKVYKVTTDNIYRIIGKIYYQAFERINRIDFNEWTEEKEKFWINEGHKIIDYKEPKLSEDN